MPGSLIRDPTSWRKDRSPSNTLVTPPAPDPPALAAIPRAVAIVPSMPESPRLANTGMFFGPTILSISRIMREAPRTNRSWGQDASHSESASSARVTLRRNTSISCLAKALRVTGSSAFPTPISGGVGRAATRACSWCWRDAMTQGFTHSRRCCLVAGCDTSMASTSQALRVGLADSFSGPRRTMWLKESSLSTPQTSRDNVGRPTVMIRLSEPRRSCADNTSR